MSVKFHTNKISTSKTDTVTLTQQSGIETLRRTQTQKSNRSTATFPDQPLISSCPLRYNVQLNQQLTSVQQAYRYLMNVERQLSHYYHAQEQEKSLPLIQQQANKLLSLLHQRSELSGGTVDRQLQVELTRRPKVDFTSNDIDNLLQQSTGETLLFSVSGTKNKMTAVKFAEQSTLKQRLLQLNKGLGRFGIHGQLRHDQTVFSVDESQWSLLNNHFSARGEGHGYPKEQFTQITLQLESAAEQHIQQIVANPTTAKNHLDEIQNLLDKITQQLRQLSTNKEKVHSRISGMSTFSQPGSALLAAQILTEKLSHADNNYSTLSQAISGQDNVHSATVKNLLCY